MTEELGHTLDELAERLDSLSLAIRTLRQSPADEATLLPALRLGLERLQRELADVLPELPADD